MIRARISAGARGHVWMNGCCSSFPSNDLHQWHSHRLEKTCTRMDFYILYERKNIHSMYYSNQAPKITKRKMWKTCNRKEQCLNDGKGCCYSNLDFSRALFTSCVHHGKVHGKKFNCVLNKTRVSKWQKLHFCVNFPFKTDAPEVCRI